MWHTVLGVEQGIEAVMSPPHIFMLLGLVLISSIPFRAAWDARDEGGDAPPLRTFLPALLSLTLSMLIISLGAIYLWGFTSARFMSVLGLERFIGEIGPAKIGLRLIHEAAQERAFGNILITNFILLSPVFLMLRRWHLPFGSVTILFTITGGLMAAVSGMFYLPLLVAPVVGGLLADWLIQAWRLSPLRVGRVRVFAIVVPLVLWSLYFAATQLLWGVAWSPGLWSGTILWTATSGLGLSVVAIPDGRTP